MVFVFFSSRYLTHTQKRGGLAWDSLVFRLHLDLCLSVHVSGVAAEGEKQMYSKEPARNRFRCADMRDLGCGPKGVDTFAALAQDQTASLPWNGNGTGELNVRMLALHESSFSGFLCRVRDRIPENFLHHQPIRGQTGQRNSVCQVPALYGGVIGRVALGC